MPRTVLLLGLLAIMLNANPAFADAKSDCVKGVAMIKAELEKKHSPSVLEQLRKALNGAELEVTEADWSECLDHIRAARKTLGSR